MKLTIDLLISFVAAMAYGILFNVPKRALFWGGVTGLLGWLGYAGAPRLLGVGQPAAALCGSILVSVASELFARVTRHPATVFIVPGIIPLVPGAAAYRTMLLFLRGRTVEGIDMGVQTAFFAGGVAAGLLVVGSIFSAIKHHRHQRRQRRAQRGG